MGKLINIDNGGTLTDICVIDGATVTHTKTLTTPYDLSKCFVAGLRKAAQAIYGDEDQLDELLIATDHIRYSTTQGTNALVERKGPRLGLIISASAGVTLVRDADNANELFATLVGDRIAEFDAAIGDEKALEAQLIAAVSKLAGLGANRIVVGFSEDGYRAAEMRFKDLALRKFPRHLLGVVPILCAGDLVEDADAARRIWTALINAFLHPVMDTFLYNAEGILREHYHQPPLLIFRNDGDSARVARSIAIKTYSSGPRGGMEGARALAAHYKAPRLLSMDIGGTTTDIGLIVDGAVREHVRGRVEGIAVSLPLSDVVSVGLGGSSIITVVDGTIRIGPESTGGAPGPACFGLGGQQATITDVFLLSGLIDTRTYFGGAMTLDADRARSAVMTLIADPLGLTLEAALAEAERAWGGKAAESLKRYVGGTPAADTMLAAFGGAGPFIVTAIAEAAGITRAIIPGLAAVFSAFGIGFSDIAQNYELPLAGNHIDALVEQLRARAQRDMFAEGFDMKQCTMHWRCLGTQAETVWNPGQALPAGTESIALRVVKPLQHAQFDPDLDSATVAAQKQSLRSLRIPGRGEVELPVYRIEEQPPGASGVGPCVLEEAYFTGRVDAGWRFEIKGNRDTVLTRIDGGKTA